MKFFNLFIMVTLIPLLNLHAEDVEDKKLETFLVIGEAAKAPATNLVGSLDILTGEEIAYEHVDDTLEIFNKIPGVYLSRYNQGIINTDVAIRGFAGDGVSPHAKLLIDGIPANLHNGYNELDQLFPSIIESLSVFKGTSDPRYGMFNIAGNYNINTRQDEANELEINLGSFDTKEVQGYFGSTIGDFQQNYSLGYRNGKGYRDHTDLTKYAVSGSWQWALSDSNQLRFIARTASYEGDAPGYLTEEQAKDNPKESAEYANQDGGNKRTNHLSLHWGKSFNESLVLAVKSYWQSFERERWVRFSEAGSLQNRYDNQKHFGVISTLDWAFKDGWSLAWGVDYESQDNIEQRFGTIDQLRERDTNTVIRDFQYNFASMGSYVKLENESSDKWFWNIAIRADQIGNGDFTNQASNEKKDIYDFKTILQPKFNLLYKAHSFINFFANAGRSFQHPIGSSLYTADKKSDRDVSFNDGWELGSQFKVDRSKIRISYWQQKAKNEFILIDGVNQNVGETDRDGVDVAFSGDITDDWSYWGSYTLINSKIIKATESLGDVSGNQLRSVPDFTATLGLKYQVSPNLITRLNLDAQGSYYVNESNKGGKFGDYKILSFGADYNLSWGALKLRLNNLTNEYFAYVYDFSTDGSYPTIHSPGDGLNGNVSINLDF